ncbi:MAG: hypothetical protein HQL80_07870, partial [Magnetococcales bacterium]|nr:hypothetical protein [Magnetococcales bacterium]
MKPIRSKATAPKASKPPITSRLTGGKSCAVPKRRPHRGSLWRTASGEKRFSLTWPRLPSFSNPLSWRKKGPAAPPIDSQSPEGTAPRKKHALAKRWIAAGRSLALGNKITAIHRRLTATRTVATTEQESTTAAERPVKRHRLREKLGSIGHKLATQKMPGLPLRRTVPPQAPEQPKPAAKPTAKPVTRRADRPLGDPLARLGLTLLGGGFALLALLLPTQRTGTPAPRKRPPIAIHLPKVPAFLARRTLQVPVQSPESIEKRLKFLFGMFLLAFLVLAARAVDLTVVQHETLKARAQSQYRKRIVTPAHRGRILDRNGKTLSVSLPVKSLSVDVDRVEDASLLAERLAPLIDWPLDQLRHRLSSARKGSFPVLQHQLTPMVIHKIQQMENPALFLTPEVQRFYPIGEVTSHILGFTDFDGHGVEGLERSLEAKLQGKPGETIFTHDRLGQPMPMDQATETDQPGMDVVLTIDTNIQYIAYRTLLKGITKTKAKGGTVVVMNPNNGEIYAMVNQPGFNPNNLSESKADERRNRAIADAYEPGSTFKTFTVSAALDLGLVKPTTTFDVQGGTLRIGGRTIRDFHSG